MSKLKTKEEFIEDAKKIHGDKYDYSKVEYKGNKTKVCIICPEHGEFWQEPNSHLRGCGCEKCYNNRRGDTLRHNYETFVEKAKKIHGDKYDYSKVNYIDAHTKVCIVCLEHGEFWQKPNTHLNGCGCPKCSREKKSKDMLSTKEIFVEKASKLHCNKYDYSKVKYVNNSTKVCIVCLEHGEFWQKPNTHLNGCGCPKCSKSNRLTKEDFVRRAKQVHGENYDYSKVDYKNARSKVCVICKEHGEFWQRPADHLNGAGCPTCSQSHLERDTRNYLLEKNINFIQEKMFNWLGLMRLDFYLPDYNIAIECQGIEHFKPIDYGGKGKDYAREMFNGVVKRDKLKRKLCESHNIRVIYINYNENVSEEIKKLI